MSPSRGKWPAAPPRLTFAAAITKTLSRPYRQSIRSRVPGFRTLRRFRASRFGRGIGPEPRSRGRRGALFTDVIADANGKCRSALRKPLGDPFTRFPTFFRWRWREFGRLESAGAIRGSSANTFPLLAGKFA